MTESDNPDRLALALFANLYPGWLSSRFEPCSCGEHVLATVWPPSGIGWRVQVRRDFVAKLGPAEAAVRIIRRTWLDYNPGTVH